MIFEVKVSGRQRRTEAATRVLLISERTEMMMRRAVRLAQAGFEVTGVAGPEQAFDLLAEDRYSAVIVGHAITGHERAALLEQIRRAQPDAALIEISRSGIRTAGGGTQDFLAESLLRALRHERPWRVQ